MIALFFEVTPRPGQDDRYLQIAASLKPELEANGGVVFLDRCRSLSRPRVLLSHQIWADEACLARWRATRPHYGAQTAGRSAVFEDYRLRVAPVVAELGTDQRIVTHAMGVTYNDPARRPERYMAAIYSEPVPFEGDGCETGESYLSVYRQGAHAWVGDISGFEAGMALLRRAAMTPKVHAARLCLVSRDYGMFDRGEAPQYFPQV